MTLNSNITYQADYFTGTLLQIKLLIIIKHIKPWFNDCRIMLKVIQMRKAVFRKFRMQLSTANLFTFFKSLKARAFKVIKALQRVNFGSYT